jgi:hypothetical protein
MAARSLSEKLLLKSWDWLLLIDSPEGHRELFSEVELIDGEGEVPNILLYVPDKAHLAKRLPVAGKRLLADGTLWVAYPKAKKLGTDLNRDSLWKAMEKHGFRGVRLVSLDDTWSAMMFRRA